MISAFDRVENIVIVWEWVNLNSTVGNGENVGHWHFLLFHLMFDTLKLQNILSKPKAALTLSQTSPGFYVSAL